MSSPIWDRLRNEMTANVEAPTLTPPRVSLLSAADIVPVTDSRWESGFTTWTEGCEVAYLFAVCPAVDDIKDADGGGEKMTYKPYVVFATDKCSTYPAGRDFYGRATRKLILAESTKLERELWLGEAGGNPALSGWTDDSGAHEPVTLAATGTQTAIQGIGILDQALAGCSSGQGMIHVRPYLMAELLLNNTIRREGNVYKSPMDNIVVPGRGYPGTGPAGQAIGATEWMYANTGIVQVRHSEIIYNPPQTAPEWQRVDHAHNDKLVYAERVTHVALDPTCCVFATEVGSLAVS